MLILFFIISLSCPLFNGMDQNDVEVQNACWTSCWNSLGNLCPQNCWDFHFGECINACWNNFCNNCNRFFGNQNSNQSDYHPIEEEECEADYEGDGSEFQGEQHNIEEEGDEGPQTTQHYDTWDEDITEYNPEIHTLLEGMNIGGRRHVDDFDLLNMFDERILQNVRQICIKLGHQIHVESPWTSNLCNITEIINRLLTESKFQKEYGNPNYHKKFTNISTLLNELYEEKHEICNYVDKKEKLIKEGAQIKHNYKTTSDNIAFLPGIGFKVDHDNMGNIIEKAKYLKDDLMKELARIACKVTIIIAQLCHGEPHIECLLLEPALTIFAVELFITTIFADGFDHLVGKWPISMYKNFEEGESSHRGGNGSE
uniref:Uncharacterized protein n=1 Tax=Meloidogyne javanica TaxID=6303 RepID=A0A915MA85_MELJA